VEEDPGADHAHDGLDQGKRAVERRGRGWKMVDGMQEWADRKVNPQMWKRLEEREEDIFIIVVLKTIYDCH
jgi:hypothetical protein